MPITEEELGEKHRVMDNYLRNKLGIRIDASDAEVR